MYKTGVCSITFRRFSAEEVIMLVSKAGLEGIEWGGDIHVPPGDLERASEVGILTEQAGLDIVSYGSYYRVGEEKNNDVTFETILDTADHLNAPAIRVWAGKKGSEEADHTYREKVVTEARKIARMAERKNISIHVEYHGRTLTDTKDSAALLMEEVDHPNLNLYWQPAVGQSRGERIDSIQHISPWLSHVHVFHWNITNRLPLELGKEDWLDYLETLKLDEGSRYLLLEFVMEDSQEQFLKDAITLRELVKSVGNK